MSNHTRKILLTFGILGFISPVEAVITYTITSAPSGLNTYTGNILDSGTLIGTWTSTITANVIADAIRGTGAITAIPVGNLSAFLPTANSAPDLGIGIRMQPYTGDATPGVTSRGVVNFNLTYSATLTAPGYSLLNSYISATTGPGVTNYGPNFTNGGYTNSTTYPSPAPARAVAAGNTNVLTFSGFTGTATLTEGIADNLAQANGHTFTSGGTLNWTPSTISPLIPDGDRLAANANWYVTIPTANSQTITYNANMGTNADGTIYTPAYNETTGFSFNIIPEPSSAILFGAGILGLVARRRRSN